LSIGSISSLKRSEETTEVAAGIYNYPYASRHRDPAYAGNKCVYLSPLLVDADFVGLASNTFVADIDIVVAHGEIVTGRSAQRDVVAAGCVVSERSITAGCVVAAQYNRLPCSRRAVVLLWSAPLPIAVL
jgi:hypothetical protein